MSGSRATRRLAAVIAVALLVIAVGPAVAVRAATAPNIVIDSAFFPANGGILAQDFTSSQGTGVVDDAKAVAVHGGRIFVVGQTSSDAGIVAYKPNGLIDTTWGPNDAQPIGGLVPGPPVKYYVRRSCTNGQENTKITLHTTAELAQTPCTDPQPATVGLTATGSQPVSHTLTSGSTTVSFSPSSPTVDGTAETITLASTHTLQNGDGVVYDIGSWSDGKVGIAYPGSAQTLINSIIVLPDGRIRLAGATGGSGALDVALVGLTANGERDTSFGANAPVPPLVRGATYYVRPTLADPHKLLLYTSQTDAATDVDEDAATIVNIDNPVGTASGTAHTLTKGATELTFNPFSGDVSPVSDTIHVGPNSLAAGDAVVYDSGTGQSTGRVTIKAGPDSEVGFRLAASPGGRIAVVGTRATGGRDDMFVALFEPTGLPVPTFSDAEPLTQPGVRAINLGGIDAANSNTNRHDRGIDVAFLPNGNPVALGIKATTTVGAEAWYHVMRAFNAADGSDDTSFSGDGELVLDTNGFAADPETGAFASMPLGALVPYGNRLFTATAVKNANDVDAVLTRVDASGGGLESRKFEMPGDFATFYGTPVSRPRDMVLVEGPEPTLVVAGSVGGNGVDWAVGGFRGLSGSLATLAFGSEALPNQARGEHSLVGVAPGGSEWVAVTGGYEKSGSDKAVGVARMFLSGASDCDLAMQVPTLELVFEGNRPAIAQIEVKNVGGRDCSGSVSLEGDNFGMSPAAPIQTGQIQPGASFYKTISLTYRGTRKPDDIATFSLLAPGDSNSDNNRFPVRAVFNYCDLAIRRESGVGYLPNEGSRAIGFNLRNVGTASCRRARLNVTGGGRRAGGDGASTLRPGRSVSSDIRVAPLTSAVRAGAAGLLVQGSADGDVNPANNSSAFRPAIIRVGDSAARRPGGRVRAFAGRAKGGRGGGRGKAAARARKLRRVQVAVMRKRGRRCTWLVSKRATFRAGSCRRPRWISAKGTRRWRLRLSRALPAGTYVLRSRAVIRAGFPEASFSRRDRNLMKFRAR